MPEINSDTPRRDLTVRGIILSAPLPYSEGHVLEANEANVMNQTWVENLRNNFSPSIVKFYADKNAWDEENEKPTRTLTPNEVAELQQDFDKYIEGYEFGVRTGGRTPLDPVMAQALQLAETQVKKAIKAKGMALSDLGREKIRSLAEDAVGKNPNFLKKAREIVEARNAAAAELEVDLA